MKKFNILDKIKSLSVSHAIIISGDDSQTKDQVVLKLSEYFTCKSSQKPCNNCNICNKTNKGINLDVYTLDNGDKNISVDEIRKIRKEAFIPPVESDKKVYIIKNAQNMNLNAANACLKILEEPPSHVCFILCVDDESVLLDTILSRCVVYRFNLENQFFDEDVKQIAINMANNIDNELEFLMLDYKKLSKVQFLDAISVIKTILKDSIMFEYNSDYVPLSDVSRDIFLKKSFNEIVRIYDICNDISEKCEYNISVLNLAYYFITEIKKGD